MTKKNKISNYTYLLYKYIKNCYYLGQPTDAKATVPTGQFHFGVARHNRGWSTHPNRRNNGQQFHSGPRRSNRSPVTPYRSPG